MQSSSVLNICLRAGALSAALPAESVDESSDTTTRQTKASRRSVSDDGATSTDYDSTSIGSSGNSSESESDVRSRSWRSLGSRLGSRVRDVVHQEANSSKAAARLEAWTSLETRLQGRIAALASSYSDSDEDEVIPIPTLASSYSDSEDEPEDEPEQEPEEEPETEFQEEDKQVCRDVVNVRAWRQVNNRIAGRLSLIESDDGDSEADFVRSRKDRRAGRLVEGAGCEGGRKRDHLPRVNVAGWKSVGARFAKVFADAGQ